MNRKLWLLILLATSLSLVFYLGYLYGRREEANEHIADISIQGPNKSSVNSLSKIETRDIVVIKNSQEVQNAGVLFFKVNEEETEILLTIDNAPLQVTQLNNKVAKEIPKKLDVATARTSNDGLNYDYSILGTITLTSNDGKSLKGSYSDIIEGDLRSIKRIVLLPTSPEDDNIIKSESPDLPALVRQRPAPYFWMVV